MRRELRRQELTSFKRLSTLQCTKTELIAHDFVVVVVVSGLRLAQEADRRGSLLEPNNQQLSTNALTFSFGDR